jgi:hypothetical protein
MALGTPVAPIARVPRRALIPRIALFGAGVVTILSCRAPTDAAQPEPAVLGLYIGEVRVGRFSSLALLPGSELTFSVRLSDAGGRVVNGLHPLLVSRSPQSLTIDSMGVVRVAGRGASWIVGSIVTASHTALADSTLINVVCSLSATPAVLLTVVDSVTGLSAGLRDIDIAISSGLVRDTVFFTAPPPGFEPLKLGLEDDLTGKFDLAVTAAGYKPWTRADVAVGRDICHVLTALVTARLQQ